MSHVTFPAPPTRAVDTCSGKGAADERRPWYGSTAALLAATSIELYMLRKNWPTSRRVWKPN